MNWSKVVERSNLKQPKSGLYFEEGQERRCGGNSTIIDPEPDLEEVLRVWAKVTDTVEEVEQRIGRRLTKESSKRKTKL